MLILFQKIFYFSVLVTLYCVSFDVWPLKLRPGSSVGEFVQCGGVWNGVYSLIYGTFVMLIS